MPYGDLKARYLWKTANPCNRRKMGAGRMKGQRVLPASSSVFRSPPDAPKQDTERPNRETRDIEQSMPLTKNKEINRYIERNTK
jgi:hypothetical protein